jgi:hypothetical protein
MKIEEVEKKQWLYILPDGTTEPNMKDAKIKLGVSKTRFVRMLKSGIVKRTEVTDSKTLNGYGNTNAFTD